MTDTTDFVLNQTMLRIKDPNRSVRFYQDVLGMTLLETFNFPDMSFSLYFMGYPTTEIPGDAKERAKWVFEQPALLELTHNHGTEDQPDFSHHNGNDEPRGFGHIGISVPDVYAACERFDNLDVEYVKRPDDGNMKGLAFIKDPDGYWIEILSASGLRDLILPD
ncbi:MAG: lactoylglutathione lyase [Pseudomonadales bacterium]